ncbi:MAG: DUF433 domain-containing protein [Proteobacteria bacterium]|nr:DUF433 domain-containing protein [Pseudomonadota bacterium]
MAQISARMTAAEIVADHPRLTVEDVRAAQAYAPA